MSNGKEYEELTANLYKQMAEQLGANAIVKSNDSIIGKNSQVKRQIDVSIRHKSLNVEYLTIIEVKDFNKPINVKTIDGFVSVIKDVGANKGIIISAKGFSKAAINVCKSLGIDCLTLHSAQNKNWEAIIKTKVIKTVHSFDIINDYVLFKVPEGNQLDFIPGIFSYDKVNLLRITDVIKSEILKKYSWKDINSKRIIRINPEGKGLHVVINNEFVPVESGDIAIKYNGSKTTRFLISPDNYIYERNHIKEESILHNLDLSIETLNDVFKKDWGSDDSFIGDADLNVTVFKYDNRMISVSFNIRHKGAIIGDYFFRDNHILEVSPENERFVELQSYFAKKQNN